MAGREKYNSLFRWVYKEGDNGVPRTGESRPPSRLREKERKSKGLKTAMDAIVGGGGKKRKEGGQRQPVNSGRKKLYFISYLTFSHEPRVPQKRQTVSVTFCYTFTKVLMYTCRYTCIFITHARKFFDRDIFAKYISVKIMK